MILDPRSLRERMRENFTGDLLYMPVHMGDGNNERPVAQLTRHPMVPKFITSTEPRTLTRKGSSLHVKGIIHHEPHKLEH